MIDDEVLLNAPCEIDQGAGSHLRIALACMSKGARPSDLEHWLRHHRSHVGIELFFIRLEDPSAETRSLVLAAEWATCVHATFADDPHNLHDCGSLQNARQDMHVQETIRAARALGCTHLLHLDDDELLYLPSGRDRFMTTVSVLTAQKGVAELHVRNLEALAPRADCDDPLGESALAFLHRPAQYVGYGDMLGSTGKSMGVLSNNPGLVPLGPHHFGTCHPAGLAVGRSGLLAGRARRKELLGTEPDAPRSRRLVSSETALVPPPIAAVLHFHCASFSRWQAKYGDHVAALKMAGSELGSLEQSLEEIDAIDRTASEGATDVHGRPPPHYFHAASCAAAIAQAAARESNDADGLAMATAVGRNVWQRWKLTPAAGLPALDDSSMEDFKVLSHGITVVRMPRHSIV